MDYNENITSDNLIDGERNSNGLSSTEPVQTQYMSSEALQTAQFNGNEYTQPQTTSYTQPQATENTQQAAYTPSENMTIQQQINAAYNTDSYNTDSYNSGYAKEEAVKEEPERKAEVKEKPVKEKPVKEHKVGRFIGKAILLALAGILFGVCAVFAMRMINRYYPEEAAIIEEADVFDADSYKSSIEQDILDKLAKNREDGIVKTVITEDDATMQVTDVSDVVEDVMPSIVSITNKFTYTTNFWGQIFSEESEASGSGIIIGENDTELLIATNNHVIEEAETLIVKFIDGTDAEAKVKGADADNDIAVIAVKVADIDAATRDAIVIAKIGDSESLKVGEPAIAIGNALGYGQSVTTGVISALNRQLEIEEGVYSEGFIQTDAAINPGNSGGALLNVYGEVIGINSNKIGGSSVEGMGYAIPVARALPIIDDLKTKRTKDGDVSAEEKGYLGIKGQAVSSEMVEVYGFPQGVFVYEVYDNTGAMRSGLHRGDIITKLEGSTIKSMEALQENLAYYKAGETVELTIARLNEDGTYDEVSVEIELISIDQMPSE